MARPGARYTCFGDGLCCTDLHGLGPLSKKEVRALTVISPGVIEEPSEDGFDEPMLRTRHDGACLFLAPDKCELHASLGPEAKPEGCRRFPLGLTATPAGGRVTTRHRCPCRTMGDRPAIDVAASVPSLEDNSGRLRADTRVSKRVRITRKRAVSFAEYAEMEAEVLQRLARGEAAAAVLDAPPFPRLRGRTWTDVAEEMLDEGDEPTRFGAALGWFAESILVHQESQPRYVDERPWEDAFDRAEARTLHPEEPERIVNDWVADEIWRMEWSEEGGSFRRLRRELATRLAVCEDLMGRFTQLGLRPDRAAAEAVMVVDLVGDSEWWSEVVEAISA